MVSSAVEKNEAGKGMQGRISSVVLNPVVRESLHVKATRVQCARADTWGRCFPHGGKNKAVSRRGRRPLRRAARPRWPEQKGEVEEARRSPEVIESLSTV